MYLVDADIYLDNRRESLLTVVYWLSRHLSAIEYKLKTNIILARNNIKEFIDTYQATLPELGSKDMERLSEIKNYLSGKEFGDEILPAIPTFEINT